MVQNAKITNVSLGYEDHGIFTCYITVEGYSWGCNYGGYCLDTYDEQRKQRVATQAGFQAIIELMKALEVRNWEDLKGQYVRVETDRDNLGGNILKIGHLLKEQWFSFEEFFNNYKNQ